MPITSQNTRLKIIALHRKNWSIYAISKHLGLIKSTISRIIQRYEERGSVDNKKSPGRPKRITPKMERMVVRETKKKLFSPQEIFERKCHFRLVHQLYERYYRKTTYQQEFARKNLPWTTETEKNEYNSAWRKLVVFRGKTLYFPTKP